MELVRFDERVTARLQTLAPEETLRVDDWPVSPGPAGAGRPPPVRRLRARREDRRRSRTDGRARSPAVVRSSSWGPIRRDRDGSPWASTRTRGRFGVRTPDAARRPRVRPGRTGSGIHRLAARAPSIPTGTPERDLGAAGRRSCRSTSSGSAHSRLRRIRERPGLGRRSHRRRRSRSSRSTRTTSSCNLKFANNTTNATTYIANLVAAMTSSTSATSTCGSCRATRSCGRRRRPIRTRERVGKRRLRQAGRVPRLLERPVPTPVRRALAILLCGKQGSNDRASGIALDRPLRTSAGYSFNQVFKFAGATAPLRTSGSSRTRSATTWPRRTRTATRIRSPIPATAGKAAIRGSTACPTLATYNGVSAPRYPDELLPRLAGLRRRRRLLQGGRFPPRLPDSLRERGRRRGQLLHLSPSAVAAPTITGVSPASGPLAGGTVAHPHRDELRERGHGRLRRAPVQRRLRHAELEGRGLRHVQQLDAAHRHDPVRHEPRRGRRRRHEPRLPDGHALRSGFTYTAGAPGPRR